MVFENEMNKPILDFFNSYHSFPEVQIDNRKIDWIFLDDKRSEIIAVELKIRDWKQVLKQSLSNTFCSHMSYAAIWHKYHKSINLDKFRHHGIGVLVVKKDSVEEIIRPEKNGGEMTESMKEIINKVGINSYMK